MYNSNTPKQQELPSTKKLFVSTIIALMVAGILLITVILPSEYGIDPTGAGKIFGLTQMGEIKMQLAKEAKEDHAELSSGQVDTVSTDASIKSSTSSIAIEDSATGNAMIHSLTLKPGQAAELKLVMGKDQVVQYKWTVNRGHLNYDLHADNESIKYYTYSKGKAQPREEGELKARFDGNHGWYWRNLSSERVTVTLEVQGSFERSVRVL